MKTIAESAHYTLEEADVGETIPQGEDRAYRYRITYKEAFRPPRWVLMATEAKLAYEAFTLLTAQDEQALTKDI